MLTLLAAVMLSQAATQDVALHVVEKKEFADQGDREVTLYPAAIQVNGKFTQHFGLAGQFTWHLHENFGVMVMGQWNYVSAESTFNTELANKTSTEAYAAASLLMMGGALAGVEVTPVYGKFALFENHVVHFSLVLNAAAGAGETRHQLKPLNAAGAATYGSTGWRFMAEVGGGLRVRLAKLVSVRLELKDIVYAANVSAVNGCDASDLTALDNSSRGLGGPPAVSGGCRPGLFGTNDLPLAKALVQNPTSDVLNNLGIYAGASLDL